MDPRKSDFETGSPRVDDGTSEPIWRAFKTQFGREFALDIDTLLDEYFDGQDGTPNPWCVNAVVLAGATQTDPT